MTPRYLIAIVVACIMSTAVQAQSRFEGKWVTAPPDAGPGGATGQFTSAPAFTAAPVFTNPSAVNANPGAAPGVPTGPAPGALFGAPRGAAGSLGGGPTPGGPLVGTPNGSARGGDAPRGTAANGRGGNSAETRLDLRVEGTKLIGTIFESGAELALNDGVVTGRQASFKTSRTNNGVTSNVNWTAEMSDDNTIVLRREALRGAGPGGQGRGAPAPIVLHRARR
jgi:hypothetical protein